MPFDENRCFELTLPVRLKLPFIESIRPAMSFMVWQFGTLLSVEGSQSERITVMDNNLSEATRPILVDKDVKSGVVHASGNRMPGV